MNEQDLLRMTIMSPEDRQRNHGTGRAISLRDPLQPIDQLTHQPFCEQKQIDRQTDRQTDRHTILVEIW